jgi:hypothetical protein
LIQRRKERAKRRYPPQTARINASGAYRRRVREDVRAKKERLHPSGAECRDLRKAGFELRRIDQWRLRGMIITASRNQCNGASVIGAICISVNARV